MKLMSLFIIGAAPAFMVSALDGQTWTSVPYARDIRSLGGFDAPNPPSESDITIVAADSKVSAPLPEPRGVLAIEIPDRQQERVDTVTSEESADRRIPPDALWPDAHGKIAAVPPAREVSDKNLRLRNPWDVRPARKAAGKDFEFECGGIIAGGDGGSVAFLNGRIARRGDSVGEFSVAGVLANGVLLERSGSYFVIPMGRRVTVIASGG